MTRTRTELNIQRTPCVVVSIRNDDPTLLEAVIDRSASRAQILHDMNVALRPYAPYRALDPRIFQAIKLRQKEGLSYTAASLAIFGDKGHAEKIRYWVRRLEAHRWEEVAR